MKRAPTPLGWGVVVATVALGVIGVLLGWVEALAISLTGLLALAVAAVSILRRPQLDVERHIDPTRVSKGGVAIATLVVRNRSRLPFGALVAADPCGDQVVRVAIPSQRRGASAPSTYRLPTDRRGVFDVGPLRLGREDPMGLLRAVQEVGAVTKLWVHPVVHRLGSLPPSTVRSLDGSSKDAAEHGSITFHSLREYVVGDNPRHIHWRSSARLGQLLVRQHVDTSQPHVTVVLDTRAPSYGNSNDFEEAVEIAASIVADALRNQFPARLYTSDRTALTSKGIATDLQSFLDRFAEVDFLDGGSLTEVVDPISRGGAGSGLFVVGSSIDATDELAVARIGRRFDRTVIVSVGPGSAMSTAAGVRHVWVADAPDFVRVWPSLIGGR